MAGLSALRRRTHAVILAGGAGERFWPHSRRHHPKPLLRVGGRETLLAATVERAIRCVPRDQVWLVCGPEHAAAMRREAGLPPPALWSSRAGAIRRPQSLSRRRASRRAIPRDSWSFFPRT